MLPLWREYNFQESDPPKIGPESDSERRRREKSTKIASGTLPGRALSPPGSILVDLGLPAGSQNEPKIGILIVGVGLRSATFRRSCSKCLPKPLRTQKIIENSRKSSENRTKIDRKLTANFVTICFKYAGGLRQKSSINSEETLGNPIRRPYVWVRRNARSV